MIYEIMVVYNKTTGKTSFALMKDRKDNLSPTEEDLKTYLSISKIVLDQIGIKLKNKLADKK
ncbi:MAG TPA: hypothetical protein HPP56_00295 [Nitrospirae bacterium]|nr:hypothetical protein [Nitrospirota bacterium]